ncbi:MAG TPA: peptide chain release factor 1 [Polyangiaceae bacterium LLY-WYZ-15_(1-7)]|nr:peptide chain release factor 1 [Sandaracinus sp.]HJK93801.1 peptide chain release factor 1 [Polyangiaceae bacterium LLY-WYZ-15_(1-7)]MBJ74699.1 peptide chain release factor 1 [Sandaracinus sp.]HJL00150.1 peptide chain release factor 1 [Polyangiaceae bacterium LLY-WYZ-15_(1-7)]HJL08898.1 peptide chain release factor 1 [Polyangiaceae bacterium LLY-WYZ-15_(1-7)]
MLPLKKLESLAARYGDIEEMLCRPEIVSDTDRLMKLTKERADLDELVQAFARYREVGEQIADDKEALKDPELRELAEAELPELEKEREELEERLQLLLLPKDPNDERDTILEIRAGTGGEEAALFAADLFRMYSRYAERQGWKVDVTSKSDASAGGFKEIIAVISGDQVYSRLRFEGGVHRVQRVPATESQGRIHTSTATVAVMPEADEVDVAIDDKDLKITKTAASGAGGQHVNTTNSAVNLLHIPTGIMVRSEQERSQHQNLAKAMQILRAKLLEQAQDEQDAAIRDERRNMVGTGERSEKIRTYNYPQNRVTDHRIGLTIHSLDKFVEGEIDDVLGALRASHQAAQLERQSEI